MSPSDLEPGYWVVRTAPVRLARVEAVEPKRSSRAPNGRADTRTYRVWVDDEYIEAFELDRNDHTPGGPTRREALAEALAHHDDPGIRREIQRLLGTL